MRVRSFSPSPPARSTSTSRTATTRSSHRSRFGAPQGLIRRRSTAVMKRTLAVLAALVALPLVALAQKPVTETEAIELTTKIEAIDHSARLVTLKDKDGESETIYCGPEVKRFDELKVGDTISVRYYESIAYAIRKPGQPSGLPAATGPKITRGQGARPSGTIAR